jgi:glycosyltransferase involved in cell wall biosynthesis
MENRNFTIVLPVRNGGEYLKECVQSILAQMYENFDLAILENHSPDGSAEWLQTLNDARVKIYPSNSDLSIEDNWARTLSIPRQEFMTFIGHDDLLTPDFLSVVNQLIDEHPDASLYQTNFTRIDGIGNVINQSESIPERESVEDSLKGYLMLQRQSYSGFVVRTSDYDQVGGIPNFTRLLWADVALWLRLTAISYKATAVASCFLLRIHAESVGVSSKGESIRNALKSFIEFLLNFQQEHQELIPVIREFAPNYFLHFARLIYLLELVDATKYNRKIDLKVLSSLQQIIEKIAPGRGNEVGNTRGLKLRTFLNSNAILRSLYILYIRIHHGGQHLPIHQ